MGLQISQRRVRSSYPWQISLVYLVTVGSFVAMALLLPKLLIDWFELSLADAGLRGAGFTLLAIAARPLGGWLSDRIGAAVVLAVAFAGVGLDAIALSWQASDPQMLPVTYLCLSMATFLGAGTGVVFKLVPQRRPPRSAGAATAPVAAPAGPGPAPRRPRVVIAGGGIGALEAVLALGEIAGDRLDVTLVTASPRFEYRPLSVAEPFDLGRAYRFDLTELLEGRGVELVVDAVDSVDVERRGVHTAGGLTLRYDALLVAIGARREAALPGAVAFNGPGAPPTVRRLLADAAAGRIDRLAFAVPRGVTWSLPAYELALMAAAHLEDADAAVDVSLVTPESRPLEAFGDKASAAVEEMLVLRRVRFHAAVPVRALARRLLVEDGEPIPADAVVALPRLIAPRLTGLPHGPDGFIPIDEHASVPGAPHVYAAGDATTFPLKQGGMAAQQADAAAEAIAAELGIDIDPTPFRPELRGLLLTGPAPRRLRTEILRPPTSDVTDTADGAAIPWPPAKVAGRRLAPLLARQGVPPGAPRGAVALELVGSPDGSSPDGHRVDARSPRGRHMTPARRSPRA